MDSAVIGDSYHMTIVDDKKWIQLEKLLSVFLQTLGPFCIFTFTWIFLMAF